MNIPRDLAGTLQRRERDEDRVGELAQRGGVGRDDVRGIAFDDE